MKRLSRCVCYLLDKYELCFHERIRVQLDTTMIHSGKGENFPATIYCHDKGSLKLDINLSHKLLISCCKQFIRSRPCSLDHFFSSFHNQFFFEISFSSRRSDFGFQTFCCWKPSTFSLVGSFGRNSQSGFI